MSIRMECDFPYAGELLPLGDLASFVQQALRAAPWHGQVEVARGDVLDERSLTAAMRDVDAVYYLVHSLTERGFAAIDRRAAMLVAQAAREAGVSRIVYLGGLHPDAGDLSEHLGSRAEVGEIFLRSGVPTVVLQAAVVIGSGSASFEMLRHLTERLPLMVTPRWVRNHVQPIAIRDVLHYLVAAATMPAEVNRSFDIGGPDVLTYAQMMQRYAAVCGLPRRRMLPVAVLSPWLSSHWINVVTPVPKVIGAPLIASLVHEAICREDDIDSRVPAPEWGRTGYEDAVRLALEKIHNGSVGDRLPAASAAPSDPLPSDPGWSGGSWYVDRRARLVDADPRRLWGAMCSISGTGRGYRRSNGWSVRCRRERVVSRTEARAGGGLGAGDVVGRWRVEEVRGASRTQIVRLRADRVVAGRAWLELSASPGRDGASLYRQRAVFVPTGLAGHVVWWLSGPLREVVLWRIARSVVTAAESQSGRTDARRPDVSGDHGSSIDAKTTQDA